MIPKKFIAKKDSKKIFKDLLKWKGESAENMSLYKMGPFLDSCDLFLKEQVWEEGFAHYHFAEQLANGLEYTKKDVEELSKKITLDLDLLHSLAHQISCQSKEFEQHREDYYRHLGIFFSALINKIIKKDEVITLEPNIKLDFICMRMGKGLVKVLGNLGHNTAYRMGGGELIVEGNVGCYTGYCMENGKVRVKGDMEHYTGLDMTGGEIYGEGKIERLAPTCKGKIFQKGIRVWPR